MMPKNFPASLAVLAALLLNALSPLSQARPSDDHSKFLNFVIYDLPPKYFADISLDDRSAVMKKLSTDPGDNRLSYPSTYLHWSSIRGRIKSSSQLWVKLLPRDEGRVWNRPSPYVFVHMSKAFEKGPARAENQSFVLNWRNGNWEDVTEKILPEDLDRNLYLLPEDGFPGIRVLEDEGLGQVERALYVWQDNSFQEKPLLRHHSQYERPFEPQRLAAMALTPEKDGRALTETIIHAGLAKDDRFRYLLKSEKLNSISSVAMALAYYRYAIDQDPTAVDFIVRRVAEEGKGDTNSLWIMSYFDEWDKTIAAYDKYSGGDGAAGEASWLWMETRKEFYPEKFEKWIAKRQKKER